MSFKTFVFIHFSNWTGHPIHLSTTGSRVTPRIPRWKKNSTARGLTSPWPGETLLSVIRYLAEYSTLFCCAFLQIRQLNQQPVWHGLLVADWHYPLCCDTKDPSIISMVTDIKHIRSRRNLLWHRPVRFQSDELNIVLLNGPQQDFKWTVTGKDKKIQLIHQTLSTPSQLIIQVRENKHIDMHVAA